MRILALLTSLVMSVGLYPQTYRIVEMDRTHDIVTIADPEDYIRYDFYGCEDYEVGDLVSAIMFDNGTEDIHDDAIISVQYAGF